jgi:hypothetical protein
MIVCEGNQHGGEDNSAESGTTQYINLQVNEPVLA